jgi:hypothetical protein
MDVRKEGEETGNIPKVETVIGRDPALDQKHRLDARNLGG